MKRVNSNYKDFFSEANKSMSPQSIVRAEEKADQILLNLKLGELRKELGVKQGDIKGFSQSGVSKIEGREDLKISTLVSCGLTDRRKLKAESTEEITVVFDPGSLGCHLSSVLRPRRINSLQKSAF